MAKKRKKSRKALSSHDKRKQSLSLPEQEQLTQSLLAAKKYREASESCKILLKQESRPEWLVLLATIYEGRARELAAKGMLKEAVMIWRNRADLCGQPIADLFYCKLLISTGMTAQVLTLYQQHQADFEQQGVVAEVREQLAAFSLTQSGDFLNALAEDDPLRKDFSFAMGALQAYCDEDDENLQRQLASISFRSPFRDLRQILKAFFMMENDTVAAVKLMNRIPKNSPFNLLNEAMLRANLPINELFSDISTLTPALIQFIALRNGFSTDVSEKFVKLFNELRQLGESPSPEALMRLIVRQQKNLGKDYAREIALRVLMASPKSLVSFNKSFMRISAFERHQIEAWNLEKQKGHPLQIVDTWNEAEKLLEPQTANSIEEYKISRALISRHNLGQLERFGDCEDEILSELESIIHYDPEDRESYLRLIAIHRQQGDLKQARTFLDRAFVTFPDDVALLTEAVEIALAGKAYKKAATLAKRILEKDPINARVRKALIDAHLSHSRKLIKQSKHKLAEKELEIAQSWARTDHDRGHINLVCGTLQFDLKQVTEAAETWQSVKQVFGELSGHFYLLIELFRQERPVEIVLKRTNSKHAPKQTSKEELLGFLNILKTEYKNTEEYEIIAAVEMLGSAINRALKYQYSQSEFDLICDITNHFELEHLTQKFAKKARKNWPDEIIYEFYAIQAKAGIDDFLSKKDIDRLETLRIKSREKGDTGLTHRINNLLDQYLMPSFFSDDDDEFEPALGIPDVESFIDSFLEMIPENELKKLGKEVDESDPRKIAKAVLLRDLPNLMFDDGLEDNNFDMIEPPPKKKKRKKRKVEQENLERQLELF